MLCATDGQGRAAPRPAAARGRPTGARAGALSIAALLGCGAPAPAEVDTLPPEPGYPPTTSRLTLPLGGEFRKLCHASLVDPRWALTAAHCLAGVDPSARGALNEFERSLAVRDIVLHPGALRDGATVLDAVRETSDFVAAHDLALVPIDPPFDEVAPLSRWQARSECSLATTLDVRGRFGQLGPKDQAQTVEAHLIGMVTAASLLGPEHGGSLLSAQGASVGPGDSGSGVSADWSELQAIITGCARTGVAEDDEVLVGVIQDANIERSTLPFGLTPLYPFDHSRWLATIIETAPAPVEPERPRLEP